MPVKKSLFFLLMISVLFASACKQETGLFTTLSSSQTNIDFSNTLEEGTIPGDILSYIYYYNGAGVAVGDINNDGLPDIYFAANSTGHNKLYLNKGNFKFEDITEKAGVEGTSDWCTGVTMADVNGDGLLDIYVCAIANMHQLHGHNELFINNGNGTFTESSAQYGLAFSGFSTQAAFFDYDGDGDLDCYILNQSEHPNQNIGDTSLRRKFDPNSGGRLFRNDLNTAAKKFTDISASTGIYQSSLCYGLGLAIGDFNNDGWDDIYIGNDFHENDYYYINNGNGTFTESGAKHFKHYSRFSMGNDAADFNNDGQLDIITTDMLPPDEKTLKTYGNGEHLDIYEQKIIRNGYQDQVSRNCLQRNNGDGENFSDVGLMSGVSATDWSWSPLFTDFDNDGNKDLFISTGIVKRPVDLDFIMYFSNSMQAKPTVSKEEFIKEALDKMPDGASHPYFFSGDGALHFKDVSNAWGTGDMKGYFNGAAYADLNNDGKVDVVMNCLNAPAVVLQNNTQKKKYLSLVCKGEGMNTTGIGTKVWLFTGAKKQYQQLMLTRGFMSSSEPRLHFGLDSLTSIDSLLVVWPNQKYQVIKNVSSDQQLIVKQKEALLNFKYEDFFPKKKALFEDVTSNIHVNWKHQEDDFIDFNNQYLIPHMESTRGPKLAVADINKDGLDDVFVCGAKGQAGCLLVQNKNGQFTKWDEDVFEKNKQSEGIDAQFFDANNDGYPDLYVASGGNENADGDAGLKDHLYMNNGKGHFTESTTLPSILTNKSCVTIADVNKDGSPDIFIGGLADAKAYGIPQSSYLLLNDGKGNFKQADSNVIQLQGIGMVTAATFTDINKDGWMDLIVSGEWMPLKIFMNKKGKFEEKDIPQSSGLWQTLYAYDINGDGYTDMLAGNWGQNSKLYSGKNGPLQLYLKDFDNNGSIDQVMTYTIDGKEYPFLGKDQLDIDLPLLKKQHLTYGEVAGQTVQYMFGDLFAGSKKLTAETLSSSVFMNDGKGNFARMNLPDQLQLAPLFLFVPAYNNNDSDAFIGAGNFYGVLPYEGRYDAMIPAVFSFDNKTDKLVFQSDFPNIDGEIRDAKWINYTGGKKLLILARNNDSLVFLQPMMK